MNDNHIATLINEYDGERIFNAKKDGYSFDVFSDTWELGYKNYLYLAWINTLDVNTKISLDLRLTIAHAAKHYAYKSINGHVSTLKTIIKYLNVYEFRAWWLTLDTYKKTVRDALRAFCWRKGEYESISLTPLYEAIKNEALGRTGVIKGIFDDETGAYSSTEHNNLLEAIRIETLQALDNQAIKPRPIIRIRNVIACQLMLAIVRRPTQLIQIKWCDFLPVGEEFRPHKESSRTWNPVTQHLFSDIEQLHLRTFKGKDDQFRGNVEPRSHRLSPDLSDLILRYYQSYRTELSQSLLQKNITLTDEEITELIKRLPLLPDQSLFSSTFQSKSELFCTVSDTSNAYHLTSGSLTNNITNLFYSRLNVESDRISNKPLKLSNNRWRHTQLSLAVWMGLSPAQIAMITGVTIAAILPYLDLKTRERVMIDQAYAGNNIIQRFDRNSVKELKKDPDFSVKSPFEEEIGYQINPANCTSCQSKGGAPMACYPCGNFRPLETANHQQYLDKAEQKLALNSQSGHPATVNRLQMIIIYIRATISVCNERNTAKLRGHD
ncbi:hypothetical protein [Vibrio minamisatsumaniensis]|uniref:hypothetical protein n=1 Tax=Vibrio minamisatsumaniensis TaxID=2910243 RepID=UPI003D2074F0